MASVAICTAVWNPKVTSVADRSLSIVLGTPTTSTPSPASRLATPEGVLATDGDEGVDALLARVSPAAAPPPPSTL